MAQSKEHIAGGKKTPPYGVVGTRNAVETAISLSKSDKSSTWAQLLRGAQIKRGRAK